MDIDRWLVINYKWTRSYALNLIKHGFVRVNGIVVGRREHAVLLQDSVSIHIPQYEVRVLWRNNDICVIHKPSGLCCERVHSTPAWCTVLTDVLCKELNLTEVFLVHRLDKDTEGLMCVALNSAAFLKYQKSMQRGEFLKAYKAFYHSVDYKMTEVQIFLCKHGRLNFVYCSDECLCDNDYSTHEFYIDENGKGVKLGSTLKCVTKIKPIDQGYDCILVTGRTHQIRLMMLSMGTPIWGDKIYGTPGKLMLFSYYLGITVTED